jgi:hypothetical protein
LPIASAARCAVELLAKGQKESAARVLYALVARDPSNRTLRKNLADLSALIDRASKKPHLAQGRGFPQAT